MSQSEDPPRDSQTTLKPCPFCGSPDLHLWKSVAVGGWAVECDDCRVIVTPLAEGKRQVMDAWNQRAA
jgi:Lar family restriction alleviation protein